MPLPVVTLCTLAQTDTNLPSFHPAQYIHSSHLQAHKPHPFIHPLLAVPDPQPKIDNHSPQQRNRQHRRPQPVVEPSLPSHPDALGPPMKCEQRVEHCAHGHDRKQPSADAADVVAEVEQSDGKASEDDGEVEPGEKGALVGEEDFGLDARGEGDALAWGDSVKGQLNGDEWEEW